MLSFPEKKQDQQWILKLITIILLFAFLGWAVWWYFNYRLQVIKTRLETKTIAHTTAVTEKNKPVCNWVTIGTKKKE